VGGDMGEIDESNDPELNSFVGDLGVRCLVTV
jgi:hypothetical protein